MQEVRSLRLDDNVRDVGYMSQVDSLAFSRGADVLLVMVRGGSLVAAGTIPGKVYEAIALGKHVLCVTSRDSDLAKLVQEYGNCTIADPTDVETVREALTTLIARFSEKQATRSLADRAEDFSMNSRKSNALAFLQLASELQALQAESAEH